MTALDLRQLSARQLMGLACAVCGAALRSTDRPRTVDRRLRDRYGYLFTLWACTPVCRRAAAVPPASTDPVRA